MLSSSRVGKLFLGGLNRRFASSASPHGGKLMDQMITDAEEKKHLISQADEVMDLNDRQACDTELLMNGGFSPLSGFMNEEEYHGVVDNMRLPGSNLLFGLPVVLDTNEEKFEVGKKVLLKYKGADIAMFEVGERFKSDILKEADKCYGTTSIGHPAVQTLVGRGKTYMAGKVTGLNIPIREFPCQTPAEVREMLPHDQDVVAFQCRNPIHRAHYELFMRAREAPNVHKDSVVLVHPTCGPTQDDDIPGNVRYKTYLVLKEETNDPRVKWAYLPYSMHMAGPRECIQHMIIRKNYGCTHFICGRDLAGVANKYTGEDFYGPYDAQDLGIKHQEELGIEIVPSLNLVYTEEEGYVTIDKANEMGIKPVKLSGTEFRRRLRAGEEIPEWFAFKSVVDVLRQNI